MDINKRRQKIANIIHKQTGQQVILNEVFGDVAGFFGNILNPGGIFTGLGAGIDEEAIKRSASPASWILFKAMAGPGTDEDAIEKVFAQYRTPQQIAALADDYDRLIAALVKEKSGIGTAIKKVGLGALRGSLLGAATGYAGNKLVDAGVEAKRQEFLTGEGENTLIGILDVAKEDAKKGTSTSYNLLNGMLTGTGGMDAATRKAFINTIRYAPPDQLVAAVEASTGVDLDQRAKQGLPLLTS